MDDTGIDPFLAHGILAANPHLYDYIHTLEFDPVGRVEMVDGAGQVLNTLVKGTFSLEMSDRSSAQVQFRRPRRIQPLP